MEKLKTFGFLFLAMLSCFILGGYSVRVIEYKETIGLGHWILTSLFGIYFLCSFLFRYREDE